jgi:antitoxin ParD1/3/4
MSSSINLSLTDELRKFIDQNTGNGSLYATPSEFLRSLLREKKDRLEARELRNAILEGYQDAIGGRVTPFSGNLKADLDQFLSKNSD